MLLRLENRMQYKQLKIYHYFSKTSFSFLSWNFWVIIFQMTVFLLFSIKKFWPLRFVMYKVKSPFASLLLREQVCDARSSRSKPILSSTLKKREDPALCGCDASSISPGTALFPAPGLLTFCTSASLLFCLRWNQTLLLWHEEVGKRCAVAVSQSSEKLSDVWHSQSCVQMTLQQG